MTHLSREFLEPGAPRAGEPAARLYSPGPRMPNPGRRRGRRRESRRYRPVRPRRAPRLSLSPDRRPRLARAWTRGPTCPARPGVPSPRRLGAVPLLRLSSQHRRQGLLGSRRLDRARRRRPVRHPAPARVATGRAGRAQATYRPFLSPQSPRTSLTRLVCEPCRFVMRPGWLKRPTRRPVVPDQVRFVSPCPVARPPTTFLEDYT